MCVCGAGRGGGTKNSILYCPPPVSGESVTGGISGGVVVTLSTSFFPSGENPTSMALL